MNWVDLEIGRSLRPNIVRVLDMKYRGVVVAAGDTHVASALEEAATHLNGRYSSGNELGEEYPAVCRPHVLMK